MPYYTRFVLCNQNLDVSKPGSARGKHIIICRLQTFPHTVIKEDSVSSYDESHRAIIDWLKENTICLIHQSHIPNPAQLEKLHQPVLTIYPPLECKEKKKTIFVFFWLIHMVLHFFDIDYFNEFL